MEMFFFVKYYSSRDYEAPGSFSMILRIFLILVFVVNAPNKLKSTKEVNNDEIIMYYINNISLTTGVHHIFTKDVNNQKATNQNRTKKHNLNNSMTLTQPTIPRQ